MRRSAMSKVLFLGASMLIFSGGLLLPDKVASELVVVNSIAQVPAQPVAKPSITLVALSTKNRTEFSAFTIDSFIHYAWRWGYQFHLCTTSLEHARHPSWSKIRLLMDLMKNGTSDWYVWLDDDLVITNPQIPMEQFIRDYGDGADFIVSAHVEKPERPDDVCCGMFLVRRSAWAQYFLQRIWDIGYLRYGNYSTWEQRAVEELLVSKEFSGNPKIRQVPVRRIQSFFRLLDKRDEIDEAKWREGQWRPGDFAAHMVGANHEARVVFLHRLALNPTIFPELPPHLRATHILNPDSPK